MQVKTYRAETLQDALLQIRLDLGNNAIIIGTQERRDTRFLGLTGKKWIEVTAALDRPAEAEEPGKGTSSRLNVVMEDSTGTERANLAAPKAKSTRSFIPGFLLSRREEKASAPSEPDPEAIKKVVEPIARELRELKAKLSSPPPAPAPAPFTQKLEGESVRSEIRDLKETIEEWRASLRERELRHLSPEWNRWMDRLSASGLSQEQIDKIIERLGGSPDGDRPKESIRAAMLAAIHEPKPILLKGRGPKLIALVGPTGVGKTTTVAKIAALWAVREGKKVSVISADRHRVGATEQLRAFADIIGIPIAILAKEGRLDDTIRRMDQSDLILIDTAGFSLYDDAAVGELAEFFSRSQYPIDVHLVLSAPTRDQELARSVEVGRRLGVSRVLMTKIDEVRTYGSLYGVLSDSELPLSYVGLGTRVPEDLGVMTKEQIVDFVLG